MTVFYIPFYEIIKRRPYFAFPHTAQFINLFLSGREQFREREIIIYAASSYYYAEFTRSSAVRIILAANVRDYWPKVGAELFIPRVDAS